MTTRIDKLELQNYRSFAKLSVTFHPELTVLVAPNGGGKTAILDALAIVWQKFIAALTTSKRDGRIVYDDVRRVISRERTMDLLTPVELRAAGMIADARVAWTRRVVGIDGEMVYRTSAATKLRDIASVLRSHVFEYSEGKRTDAPVLPALCYYGTGRLWNIRRREDRDLTSRFSGYKDCLSSASNYWFFSDWFGRFSREAQSEIESRRASPHKPRQRLAAVRNAVGKLLAPSGWQQLEWDFAEDVLVASHPEYGRLPVRLLSDGIRSMIGMVGDLAHRCVRLNPQFGADAAKMTPGVVLVDEVDMHLHPAWQQMVTTGLREVFPRIQFVVTTHSHLVVSTIPSECVRILHEDGRISQPRLETQGYDSPFTLGVVFGVDSAPPIEIAKQLSHYRALVEQGRGHTEEALSLHDVLEKHFGAQHPAMLAVESMRRLQDFKAKAAAKRGGGGSASS